MDKYSVCWNDESCGELSVWAEGLYTCFRACCHLPEEGLWCIWVEGDQGELRLGVVEPQGGRAEISRRFSGYMTAPVGRVLRGELRRIERKTNPEWKCGKTELFQFKTPWIRRQLKGRADLLVQDHKAGKMLAVPFEVNQPFPLTSLFCFAEIRIISGKSYAVFSFDQMEWPVFEMN